MTRAVAMAFVASFLVYLVPVIANAHLIMPWGLLLPLLASSRSSPKAVALLAAYGVMVQGLAWLYFYVFMMGSKRLGLRLAVALPFFLVIFFFLMSTLFGFVDQYAISKSAPPKDAVQFVVRPRGRNLPRVSCAKVAFLGTGYSSHH